MRRGESLALRAALIGPQRRLGRDTKDRLTSSIRGAHQALVSRHEFRVRVRFGREPNLGQFHDDSVHSDNQLSASGYSLDGNENPTTYGGTSLTFDPENRMTAFGSTVSNSCRADGLRASKTTSAGTAYFLCDGAEPIIEMNSSGTVTATNVLSPDGLVARQTSSATTEYVFDPQGNVADRTNGPGAIQSITQYDAWGNEQVVSGSVADPFGYNARSGYYLDREDGLYLCQHRFYDPAQSRWLNRDPIGYSGGANLYGYCAGGPVRRGDPRGTQTALLQFQTPTLGLKIPGLDTVCSCSINLDNVGLSATYTVYQGAGYGTPSWSPVQVGWSPANQEPGWGAGGYASGYVDVVAGGATWTASLHDLLGAHSDNLDDLLTPTYTGGFGLPGVGAAGGACVTYTTDVLPVPVPTWKDLWHFYFPSSRLP